MHVVVKSHVCCADGQFTSARISVRKVSWTLTGTIYAKNEIENYKYSSQDTQGLGLSCICTVGTCVKSAIGMTNSHLTVNVVKWPSVANNS